MRHRLGNSPKCKDCFFYQEKSPEDVNNQHDGWCPKGLRINGKKVNDRAKVDWNHFCDDWEDAEERLTYYEVVTLKPGPWRTPIEALMIQEKFDQYKRERKEAFERWLNERRMRN